jgi:CheY-like chemotaxis protein
MGMLLEMNGHEVRIAHDGQSALAMAENFSPDVVVSDIKLPDMDGFKLARALRQLNGMDKTKFIALSGYPESEFPNQEIKFHHFLHKPVKVEELEMILAS